MMNRWKIEGYAGWSDYDGPQDNNINREIEVDSFLTKEDIEYAFRNHYSRHRVVSIKATLIK